MAFALYLDGKQNGTPNIIVKLQHHLVVLAAGFGVLRWAAACARCARVTGAAAISSVGYDAARNSSLSNGRYLTANLSAGPPEVRRALVDDGGRWLS